MLITAAEQSDSVIHKHTHSFLYYFPLWFITGRTNSCFKRLYYLTTTQYIFMVTGTGTVLKIINTQYLLKLISSSEQRLVSQVTKFIEEVSSIPRSPTTSACDWETDPESQETVWFFNSESQCQRLNGLFHSPRLRNNSDEASTRDSDNFISRSLLYLCFSLSPTRHTSPELQSDLPVLTLSPVLFFLPP